MMSSRATHLRRNCLSWAALAHFLSAPLLREFCYIAVDSISNGQLTLDGIFEEALIGSEAGFEFWQITSRPCSSHLEQYLQSRVRHFVWGNDSYVSFDESQIIDGPISPASFEEAVRLGLIDFDSIDDVHELRFPTQQTSIVTLHESIRRAHRELVENQETSQSIADDISNKVEMPLAAVMTKHIGDLYADSDHWELALRFYKHAQAALVAFGDTDWLTFRTEILATIDQSVAAALRIVNGPASASDYLREKLQDRYPLLVTNASQDAFVAGTIASDTVFSPDTRTHLLLPPLSLTSHELSSALQSYVEEHHSDARQRFFQTLRRLIALGSATESRLTKALYARALFDELNKTFARNRSIDIFWAATKLLIESGQSNLASKVPWNEAFVRSYVDTNVIERAIAHAGRHAGSKVERSMTLVEIFKGWTATGARQGEVANEMIRYLAANAIEYPASFFGPQNLGGESIKAVRELAETRPEFRAGSSSIVANAVVAKIHTGEWWTGTEEAFKVARLYADVFTEDDLIKILVATLSRLDLIDPANDIWVIVRPALDFLSSPEVKLLAGSHPILGDEIVAAILRFGINQQTEHGRLLFFLQDFDHSLLAERASSKELAGVVQHVRSRAKETNASDAVGNIQALLVCPAVSGRDGVQDAVNSLDAILTSALNGRPSLSFSAAYYALLVLTSKHGQIASDLSLEPSTFLEQLWPLLNSLKKIWIKAASDPMIFAPFSLPPQTKPNAIVVYNWAFTSIGFAKLFHEQEQLLSLLTEAEQQPLLSDPIARARASRLALEDFSSIEPMTISKETRETFYAALGLRLARIQLLTNSGPVLRALLEQCLRFGPNGLDAAVFLAAANLDLREIARNPEFSNYKRRLERDELRSAIYPLLHLLEEEHTQER